MKMRTLTVIILIALCRSVPAFAQDVLLGMLEDVPGSYFGEGNSTKVRTLFAHKDKDWIAFKSDCETPTCLTIVTAQYPKQVTWFVGFHGREIGRLAARTPRAYQFYADIGLQDIVEGIPPSVGKPSSQFAGYAGGEVRRPLVTSSKPDFKDRAGWKRGVITPAIRSKAIALLRSLAPAICRQGASEEAPLLPFTPAPKDLVIRMYEAKDGRMLITANVIGAYYCEYSGGGDGSFDDQTFGIDSNGKASLLGAGLTFVDAGDYDSDGHSELIFALSQDNRGGYVLFSHGFKEQARFEFGYH